MLDLLSASATAACFDLITRSMLCSGSQLSLRTKKLWLNPQCSCCRSQEPVPEQLDPFARPPVPKRCAKGSGSFTSALRTLQSCSEDGSYLSNCTSLGSAPSRSGSGAYPLFSSSPSKALGALDAEALHAQRVSSAAEAQQRTSPSGPQSEPLDGGAHPSGGIEAANPGETPLSPFAAWPVQDLECQPSAVMQTKHAHDSMGALHSRESSRWDGLLAHADQPEASPVAQARGASGRLGKALRALREDEGQEGAPMPQNFARGCRLLCGRQASDALGSLAGLPALFRYAWV